MEDSAGADAGGLSHLPFLSDEVLDHFFKIARLTLTDVGHLRVTCKRLCGLVDRIRDTIVNDNVVGDLSLYRPYGYWDIDLAAKSGHLEVIQLLHEDEVKRGRMTHCSNASLYSAHSRRDFEMFLFIARNRREVTCGDVSPPSGAIGSLRCEQIIAFLEEMPSLFANSGGVEAIAAAVRCGDESLAARIVPVLDIWFLRDEDLVAAALSCANDGVLNLLMQRWSECGLSAKKITKALFHGAIRSNTPAAVDRALSVAPMSLDEILGRNDDSDEEWRDYDEIPLSVRLANRACGYGCKRALARLREMGFNCSVAYGSRAEIERCLATADTNGITAQTLVDCLLDRDYDTATYACYRVDRCHLSDIVPIVIGALVQCGNVDGLRWMESHEMLLCMDWESWADSVHDWFAQPGFYWYEGLQCDMVDFLWSRWTAARPAEREGWQTFFQRKIFSVAFRSRDARLLRHLCEHVDVVGVFSDPNAYKAQNVNVAVQLGRVDIVAYMIEVNARVAPVFDSPLARDRNFFDPIRRPFNLEDALETAVANGQYGLARMIDRRLPGLRASLRAAVISRRWRIVRGVLARDPEASTPVALVEAFCDAVACGRLDFVRWFGEHYPDVVDRCVPKLGKVVVGVRDMGFLRAFLEKYAPLFAKGEPLLMPLECVSYDTFVLQQSLGIRLVDPALRIDMLVGGVDGSSGPRARWDLLRAAVDFEYPLYGLPLRLDRKWDHHPTFLQQWLGENEGKFKGAG